jgi:hypothetical protein
MSFPGEEQVNGALHEMCRVGIRINNAKSETYGNKKAGGIEDKAGSFKNNRRVEGYGNVLWYYKLGKWLDENTTPGEKPLLDCVGCSAFLFYKLAKVAKSKGFTVSLNYIGKSALAGHVFVVINPAGGDNERICDFWSARLITNIERDLVAAAVEKPKNFETLLKRTEFTNIATNYTNDGLKQKIGEDKDIPEVQK